MEAKTIKVQTSRQHHSDSSTLAKAETELGIARQVLKQRQTAAREVGATLKLEVSRVAADRRTEYATTVRICASSLAQAAGENRAIWEAARAQLEREVGGGGGEEGGGETLN